MDVTAPAAPDRTASDDGFRPIAFDAASPLAGLFEVFAAYQSATRLPASTVSYRFFGRVTRIGELLEGGDIGAIHLSRVLAKFARSWPDGAAWPASVPFPDAPPDEG